MSDSPLCAHRSLFPKHRRAVGDADSLEALSILDVRQLQPSKLDEAQAIYRDFQDRTSESSHRCAVAPVRIDLAQRVFTDMLGLSDEASVGVRRLKGFLATDLSIHGGKRPEPLS